MAGIPSTAGQYTVSYQNPPVCNENGCTQTAGIAQLVVADGTGTGSLALTGGNGQSTTAGAAFGSVLRATLTDSAGATAADTEVTFTLVSGSASFAGGATTAVVRTDSNGVATAPTLTAGSGTGPVMIVVSQPGSISATFMLSVVAAGPARADLVAAVSGPSSVARNAQVAVTVKTTNRGPAPATSAISGLVVPNGLSVASAPGGSRYGQLLIWSDGTLAPDSTASHTAVLKAGPSRKTVYVSSLSLSGTPDPSPLSNISIREVKIT